jgi:hypothetical protein
MPSAGGVGWWWCLRVPLVLGAGGARAPPLAAGSDDLDGWNRPAPASPMLQTYVSSVSGVFICMLQVFHTDVAYVATDVHLYCKLLFLMFYLFFSMYVASVFIWMFFTHMMQVFYFDVAMSTMVSNVFQVFLQVFQTHVSNISFVFRHMLQLLHLDVSKLDRTLHLPRCLSVVSPRC